MGHYEIPHVQVYAFLLIFTRLSTAFMFMPGFGGAFVNVRIRIFLAVTVSAVLYPLVGAQLPHLSNAPYALELSLIQEVLVGGFIGLVAKILLTIMEVAGSVISYTVGLSNAQIFDPEHGASEPILSTLITLAGTVLIFMMDFHHLLLIALADSYRTIPLDQGMFSQDAASSLLKLVSFSFRMGVQLSTPFLIVGLISQIAFGLVNRLMPQMQVFFVVMPLQLLGGLLLLMVTIGLMLYGFAENYSIQLQHLFGVTPYV
jgi:flagellar biosynthesis protein FliR